MIMQKGATGHLASAINFALSNGKYKIFHFLPCRYVDNKDTQSFATVTDIQDFGGKAFKESTAFAETTSI